MDCETVKGRPLTKEETRVLLDLVEASKIITTKTTNATNNKLKTAEWIRLTESFNASVAICPRTPAQLRLKWENLKKNARKRSTKIRMNHIKTGGGPAEYIPPDEILDRVAGLLGSTVSGFSVPFGGDKDMDNSSVVGCCNGDGDGDGSSGDRLEEARVVLELQDGLQPMSVKENFDVVTCGDGNGGGGGGSTSGCLLTLDATVTTPNKRKFIFNTPRVNKKVKNDDGKTQRNKAIAEYFIVKKQCLNLRNDKLMLEIEKLKLELEKLRRE